jgi:ribose 1,5-bisphosphokinase PhnN
LFAELSAKVLYYVITGASPLEELEYGFRALVPGTRKNLPQVQKQAFIPSEEQSGAIVLQCCAQMKVMCQQMNSRIDQLPTKDEVTDLIRRYS